MVDNIRDEVERRAIASDGRTAREKARYQFTRLLDFIEQRYGSRISGFMSRRTRWEKECICISLAAMIGVLRIALGPTLPLSLVYILPVAFSAWYIGMASALGYSMLAVAIWHVGYQSGYEFLGNSIRFIEYTIFAALLVHHRHLQLHLRELAEQRAHALTQEAAIRIGLEHEMLEISEREQERIGRDLHDSLCQHLTGTALASHLLAKSLAKEENLHAQNARNIVDLIEDGIVQARGIAKGLYPIEPRSDGLMVGLAEFTSTTSDLLHIDCRFLCPNPVPISQSMTAAHLYRIAQEAMNNAVKHGRATKIEVSLEETDAGIRLCVSDNGLGLPNPMPCNGGMGLRTMSDRAKFIGAKLFVHANAIGGTEVVCLVPPEA